jgi:predicted RNA-binding Zn-ribbon protein involved in translation (DUF1610 family)
MKSFRLYLNPTPVKPERCVRDCSPEEQTEFREKFKPLAARYRRYWRVAYVALGIGLVCGFLLRLVISATMEEWLFGVFFAGLVIFACIASLAPVLKCPACHNRLDVEFGEFCPECGERALQRGTRYHQAQCLVCGRTLSRGKSRHYKIRACTHCGVQLDEEGL